MKISDKGLFYITRWEGFRNEMYKDSAGFPTIGVGHLLRKDELSSGKILINGKVVRYRCGLSDDQVNELLKQDLYRFENEVNYSVLVELNQDQYDALVSFTFNVGCKAFKHSTLLRKLNDRC